MERGIGVEVDPYKRTSAVRSTCSPDALYAVLRRSQAPPVESSALWPDSWRGRLGRLSCDLTLASDERAADGGCSPGATARRGDVLRGE